MKKIGYGKNYRYPHDFPEARVEQQYLPQGLEKSKYYRPTGRRFEKKISQRLKDKDRPSH